MKRTVKGKEGQIARGEKRGVKIRSKVWGWGEVEQGKEPGEHCTERTPAGTEVSQGHSAGQGRRKE